MAVGMQEHRQRGRNMTCFEDRTGYGANTIEAETKDSEIDMYKIRTVSERLHHLICLMCGYERI
jgi:hypothetical protein